MQAVASDHQAEPESGAALIPVAFAGRVSDKDNLDPTLSIPRQLSRSRSALPPGFVIVAHFYDVESGRMDLDQRGYGTAHEDFDIAVPRDGGIAADAVRGLSAGSNRRKRATPILTRRVKQAIAEWYVLNMLELSWDGLVTHIDQGDNIGNPPYGYLAEIHKHPVPAKAVDGKVKRRLIPDPVRGPVVTQIFIWRATERLSYNAIAGRLNLDPDRYPPPQPIAGRGRRALGRWSGGAVREILCNPKYTGHMVYNRRKRSRPERKAAGKVNPPGEWVWSSKATHEPLTTRQLFEAANPIGKRNKGSRSGSTTNRHLKDLVRQRPPIADASTAAMTA